MAYWLFKSEPETYGIARLAREGSTEWSGVRNYQARNFMRTMKPGDLGFFYHSNTKPTGIAGICRVGRTAYPDFTAWDHNSPYYDPASTPDAPRWDMVDVEFVREFPRILTLDDLRALPGLAEMALLRKGQRLSVQPVTAAEWKCILRYADAQTS